MYYNTTNLEGNELSDRKNKALTQEEMVIQWFRQGRAATPSMVWKHVFNQSIPIGSVRRAVTNLKNDGALKRTDLKRTGIYGAPETVYAYQGD